MRWLITGGCGFVGKSLTRSILADGGHDIRIVDNLCAGTLADLAAIGRFRETGSAGLGPMSGIGDGDVELVIGDVVDNDLALAAVRGADVVVHLAASNGVEPSVRDPHSDCHVNVLGTLAYLDAARHAGAGRFVLASSGAPIGDGEPPFDETMPARPVSPHGAAKLAAEGYCSAYFRSFGLDTVVLRFANVYGPGSAHKSGVVARFIRQALRRETLEIFGDGRQTRDFVYIDDLVRAIRLAVSANGVGGEIFQIAANAETTVAGVANKLLPILASFGVSEAHVRHSPARAGDARRHFSDASKAWDRLGWQAETVLADGLRQTVEWFMSRERAVAAAE